MKSNSRITIGRAAELAGVSVETIRYYERSGLVARPRYHLGAYREYSQDAIRKIRFIKRAQELGFKLAEISEMLSLLSEGQTTPDVIRAKADLKLQQIEEKMAELDRIRSALFQIKSACAEQDAGKKCPILDGFYKSNCESTLQFIGSLEQGSSK